MKRLMRALDEFGSIGRYLGESETRQKLFWTWTLFVYAVGVLTGWRVL
jgi:hypothetical protein